jgi:hypothetical protein
MEGFSDWVIERKSERFVRAESRTRVEEIFLSKKMAGRSFSRE